MSGQARRVVCTGAGLVTPLGIGVERSWLALLAGVCGITNLRPHDSFEGCKSLVAAYVPDDQLNDILEAQKHEYIRRNNRQLSRASKFAMIAAHEAMEDAGILNSNYKLTNVDNARCGVAIGQGMVDFRDVYLNYCSVLNQESKLKSQNNEDIDQTKRISPYFITRALVNMSAGNISIRYNLNGPNHCVSTACATGAHSIGDAYNFIKYGQADVMLAGSTEASINSLAMAGFEKAKALCNKYNDNPVSASRPFDRKRRGFVMGEGAGVLVLESLDHALARGAQPKHIYAEILGYGTSADAHHLTAPLPNGGGATKSMKASLDNANVSVNDVGHVNAHATSTLIGDDIECNAIEEFFYPNHDEGSNDKHPSRSKPLTITSCKGAIGHLLGGAGSVETIFTMLSCKKSIIPHCLNLTEPLNTRKKLVNFVRDQPGIWNSSEDSRRIALKNSFGFGGTNASLVMSNYVVDNNSN